MANGIFLDGVSCAQLYDAACGPSLRVPSEYRFLLRSSPIICAFDALGVVALLISHMIWHWESHVTAAGRIARARFRDVEDEAEEDSVITLEKNVRVRLVAFFLGVLHAAIKLFATKGVLVLRVLGAMYLGSWIVLELLIWIVVVPDRQHSGAGAQARAPHSFVSDLKWAGLRSVWASFALIAHCFLTAGPVGLILLKWNDPGPALVVGIPYIICTIMFWHMLVKEGLFNLTTMLYSYAYVPC